MKKIVIGIAAAVALLTASAADLNWLTDAAKAQAQAKTENKLVLLDFTGSDWCGWCIKLNKEVFSTPEFAEYAKKNLVLVEVDFPRKKALGKAQKEANEALSKKYGIEGFPTLILLDGAGKKVGQLNYSDGVEKTETADRSKITAKPSTFIAAIEKAKQSQ
jgi:protein disulfide-isomerase